MPLEVLRKAADNRQGYMPTAFWRQKSTPFCWDIARPLHKRPHKITAYFHKDMITEVRKINGSPTTSDTYFLKLTDGSYLEVEY